MNKEVFYGPREDLWDQVQRVAEFDGSVPAIPNLAVRGLFAGEHCMPFFGVALPGFTIIQPGVDSYPDSIALCTGTPETCPTTNAEAAAGKPHLCGGILSCLQGDVYWLMFGRARLSQRPAGASAAGHWTPDDGCRPLAEATSRDNLARRIPMTFLMGGSELLIGPGHDDAYVAYVKRYGSCFEGKILPTARAGHLGYDVMGLPDGLEEQFRSICGYLTADEFRFGWSWIPDDADHTAAADILSRNCLVAYSMV
ncbi:hypothetical protein ACFQ78_37615 [Streptomyces sp. NPDC056519]|uniref:hypothetical protein n=1 Tax=Streptomyces sp. NPDC056519 TaxID=3345849 RepID=UPI0036A5AA4F